MKEARAELVRIDGQGVAHPIGTVASQRMRAREGAYRLLPSPAHVVFMRFTGEDGRRDAEDGAVVKIAGEVTAPGELCDVLAMCATAGWRGELVALDGETSRSVFFEQGNVVGAQTSVDDERLGMVMYRFGAINAEQHELIMERVREGKRFGESAVELGLMTRDKVFQFIGKQVEEIVFATFGLADGTFFFLDGFDANRLVTQHVVSANALLMDGVTRMDEIKYFRQKIPSSDYVPEIVEGRGQPADEFAKTYAAIDGRLNIEEIGRFTGRGEFNTTKDVYALIQSKHVAIHPPRMSGGAEAVVAAANSALQLVHQRADQTGLGTQLRESLESFAVGAGVYDILFRSAGPDERGVLNVTRVVENSVLVAGGTEPEEFLRQALYEYVSFALFSAGGSLGDAEREAELKREVSPLLNSLRPGG